MRTLIIFLFCIKCLAEELAEPNASLRALGMGNAYTAIVKDADSLFYNPAGLHKSSGMNIKVLDPKVGVNGVQTYQSLGDLNTDLAGTLDALYGNPLWLGFGGKTAFVIPNFGIAISDIADLGAYLQNPALPNLNFRYSNDLAATVGFAFGAGDFFGFGLDFKRIIRTGGKFPIGISTLGTLSNTELTNQINNTGTGYGVDTGTYISVPGGLVTPTFSFAWLNIGNTKFTKTSGSTAPQSIDNEMIGGFGLEFDLKIITISSAFDYKHASQFSEPLGKKIHLGLELGLPLLSIRGGLNQGYWTAGAGVHLLFFTVDAATWGVELGEYPGQHEDRRYGLQLSADLNLDADLSFLSGGKTASEQKSYRRKLKQRR